MGAVPMSLIIVVFSLVVVNNNSEPQSPRDRPPISVNTIGYFIGEFVAFGYGIIIMLLHIRELCKC